MKRSVLISLLAISMAALVMAGVGQSPTAAAGTPTPDGINLPGERPNPFGEQRPQLPLPARSVSPRGSGGPDQFGYSWEDVSFNWIDATSGAQVTFQNPDDSYSDLIGIGFNFEFYEHTYTQLHIGTNGILALGETGASSTNYSIPQDTQPDNLIGPFWDDLVVSGAGKVYILGGGSAPNRYFVVEWHDVNKVGASDALTFEVVLYENGNILFQYHTLSGVLDQSTVGIEDGDGLDGLLYVYNAAGLATGDAVMFERPDATARVKFLPRSQSGFAISGRATFFLDIRNTGELGSDTYDLSVVGSGWGVSFYRGDGLASLSDTNSNGVVDTGEIAQGSTFAVKVSVQSPLDAVSGDYVQLNIFATSERNPTKTAVTVILCAIPGAFAQAYADPQIGMGLDLIWGPTRRATIVDDWFSGSTLAMLRLASGGYAFTWERNGVNNHSNPYTDIEYLMMNAFGHITRTKSKLTNHEQSDQANWLISDLSVALASTPNGRIAAVWVRNNFDLESGKTNSNVFLSILNSEGAVIAGELNITNNSLWAGSDDLDIPRFSAPRITATDDNRFIVSWVDERSVAAGDKSDVVFAIFNGDGLVQKAPTTLTASTPNLIYYNDPSLAALSSNRVMVAYSAFNYTTQSYTIAFVVLNSAGNILQGATTIASAYGWKPDLLQLDSGKIAITWTNTTSGRIAFALMNGVSYNIESGPTDLVDPTARPADYSSVTSDASGKIIVTWMDANWYQVLYYAMMDATTGAIVTPPMIFYRGQAASPYVLTNYAGQSNAAFGGFWLDFLPMIKR